MMDQGPSGQKKQLQKLDKAESPARSRARAPPTPQPPAIIARAQREPRTAAPMVMVGQVVSDDSISLGSHTGLGTLERGKKNRLTRRELVIDF